MSLDELCKGVRWYVVSTKPQQEERVGILLDAVSCQSRITIDRALVEKLEPNNLSVWTARP